MTDSTYPPDPRGIPADLLQRLRQELAACPALASTALLTAVFIDERLRPWKHLLPQVDSTQERVLRVIELLHEEESQAGDNALVLLVRVLSEQTPVGDERRYRLAGLARELNREVIPIEPGRAPYMGLSTFKEEDAACFFGREAMVAQLLEKVKGNSFLAVLGPSGSGKSSVVRAWLLPVLKRGELPGSEQWRCVVLKPGLRPLNALASALAHLPDTRLPDGMTLGQMLASDEKALLGIADLLRTRLVLVVDQFEELWTQATAEPEQKQAFIRLLLAAAIAPDQPLLVILALRAEFLHRAAEHPELARWIAEHDVIVSPMQPEELRQIIEEPAALVGGCFAPDLVEKLLEEVEGKPGALPLLEYTLLDLWKKRDSGGTMTWEALRDAGGVEGALAARANKILDEQYRDEQQRDELRQLLLDLVQPGEGAEDTRRRALLSDFASSKEEMARVQRLIQPLVDERLITTGRDRETGQETVEVSHEALTRAWPTLRFWIDEARDDLRLKRQLGEAAREWENNGHTVDFLWSGLRLASAEVWLVRAKTRLSRREAQFFQASRQQEETRRKAEVARAALARQVSGVMSVLFLVSLFLAWVAWSRQQEANQERDKALLAAAQEASARILADSQARAGESLFELSRNNKDQALLLALAAVDGISGTLPILTSRALQNSLEQTRMRHVLTGHEGSVYAVAWSPDGQQVLTGGSDDTGRIWDATSGALRQTLNHEGSVYAVAWSPDGQQVLTGSEDGTARVWDATPGTLRQTLMGHEDLIRAVAWSPNGQQVLTGSSDGTAILWDVASSTLLHTFTDYEVVYAVAWSPDGQQVLIGSSDGTARL